MASLAHLIFTSAATRPFTDDDLLALLEHARPNNARRGITGMMLYTEGTFFQVIEGDEDVLQSVFETIRRDPRHTRVTVIIREPIARRAFEDWTMGLAELSCDELGLIPGLNDFFDKSSCLTRVDAGRASKLLSAFASGRWRSRIKGRTHGTEPGDIHGKAGRGG